MIDTIMIDNRCRMSLIKRMNENIRLIEEKRKYWAVKYLKHLLYILSSIQPIDIQLYTFR